MFKPETKVKVIRKATELEMCSIECQWMPEMDGMIGKTFLVGNNLNTTTIEFAGCVFMVPDCILEVVQ